MPQKIPLVDLQAQYATIKSDVDAAVAGVIASCRFIGGPELVRFEQAYAEFQGARRCVGVASGTAAIQLALQALGVGPGDEVITTPFTFIATVEPVAALGARIVLADIDPATFNLDPDRLEAAITPATRVILPVHLYGQMAPMDRILDIARRHGLQVVEDAAQAHGATYQGRNAGQWGDIATFSFYPGKNLGAYGDAGAITTENDALADTIARLRDHGRASKYTHDVIGYGERLDALQAAILGAKLPHLAAWNEARRRHAAAYDEALRHVPGLTVTPPMAGGTPVYHLYVVRVAEHRDAVRQALNERGIGAGIHYPVPLHLQPALADYGWQCGDFPQAEAAADQVLSLPLYPEMTADQRARVVETLREVLAAVPAL